MPVVLKHQEITDFYPQNITKLFPSYLKAMYRTLQREIIRERKRWKTCSTSNMDITSHLPHTFLSILLDNMPPSIFSKFLTTLYKYGSDNEKLMLQLGKLYPAKTKRYKQERLEFYYFLKTHQISSISDNNAYIFQVMNQITFDNCMIRCRKTSKNTNRVIEKHTRTCVGSETPYIASLYYERTGMINDGGTRDLQIYPFFPDGSLLDQITAMHEEHEISSPNHCVNDPSDVPRLVRGIQESRSDTRSLDPADKPRDVGFRKMECQQTLIRFICITHLQIIGFLQKCQNQGIILTDIKLENFLAEYSPNNREYTLKIIDLKSSRYLDKKGFFQNKSNNKKWNTSLVHTEGIIPMEIHADKRCSAEKSSIFMFGINLYIALTGNKIKYTTKPYIINEITDADFTDFAIFQSDQGLLLKQLIINTTKRNPDERITYAEVLQSLNNIYPGLVENTPHLDDQQRQAYLQDIVKFQSTLHQDAAFADQYFHQYIQCMQNAFQSPQTPLVQITQLDNQLQHTHTLIRTDDVIKIANTIQQTDQQEKIDILTTLQLIPFESRLEVYKSHTHETFFTRIAIIQTCYMILGDINTYRVENLLSDPIIIDIPIRRYLHSQMEALHNHQLSIDDLRVLKKQLEEALRNLQQLPHLKT